MAAKGDFLHGKLDETESLLRLENYYRDLAYGNSVTLQYYREQNADLFDAWEQTYHDKTYTLYTDSLSLDYALLSQLVSEYDTVAGYGDFLDSVQTKAGQLAGMRPRRAAGVADVGNDLPGFDLLACGDADARAVRVQCRQSTAVVELDVVAITAAPTVEGVGDSDGAVGSRQDRGAFGHSDVGAAVVAGFASDRVGAVALRRGDRARHRQRPLQRAATQRGVGAGR